MKQLILLLLSTGILVGSSAGVKADQAGDIILENDQMTLVIAADGSATSLIHKPTRTECLIQGRKVPISTITEPRPYQNEVKLAYPNKKTTFKSNAIRRQGDKLVIGYELIPWEATVGVRITPHYIAFTLEGFTLTEAGRGTSQPE